MREQPGTTLGERLFPLRDLTEIPAVGSQPRDLDERACTARARELVFECDGRLRDAMYELERELRGVEIERENRLAYDVARDYARALVSHVEQCWASAVVR